MSGFVKSDLSGLFNASAKPATRKASAPTIPLSIRVTVEEKAQLQQMAGTLAISTYIRQKLFGDGAAARPARYQKKPRQPAINAQEVAKLLAMFGQSELARSMLALSLAVQQHELELSHEVEQKLALACADIHAIKLALVVALGVQPQGDCT